MPYFDAVFSGGEVFENQYILELLCVIEKNWDKRFPLTFITNGRKLSSEPAIFEAVQELQWKYGKQMVVIQVTDDPRFYPEPLTEKQRYRLGKLGAIIDCVPGVGDKCLYPQGRALENFSDSYWNTIAPKCVNARLLAKKGIVLLEISSQHLCKRGSSVRQPFHLMVVLSGVNQHFVHQWHLFTIAKILLLKGCLIASARTVNMHGSG